MKLVKREEVCAPCTATIWWLPTLTYTLGKFGGAEYHREWIWWVVLPIVFLIWVLLNWKIEKTNDKKPSTF